MHLKRQKEAAERKACAKIELTMKLVKDVILDPANFENFVWAREEGFEDFADHFYFETDFNQGLRRVHKTCIKFGRESLERFGKFGREALEDFGKDTLLAGVVVELTILRKDAAIKRRFQTYHEANVSVMQAKYQGTIDYWYAAFKNYAIRRDPSKNREDGRGVYWREEIWEIAAIFAAQRRAKEKAEAADRTFKEEVDEADRRYNAAKAAAARF